VCVCVCAELCLSTVSIFCIVWFIIKHFFISLAMPVLCLLFHLLWNKVIIYWFTQLEVIFIVITCQNTQCYGPDEENISLYPCSNLKNLCTRNIIWYLCFMAFVVVQIRNKTEKLTYSVPHCSHNRQKSCLTCVSHFNPLTPNDPYSGRTAPLTSKRCILYIYSTNTGTEYFKHGMYSPFFFFKMQFVS